MLNYIDTKARRVNIVLKMNSEQDANQNKKNFAKVGRPTA